MTHDYSMLFGLMRKRGYTIKKLAIELNKKRGTINQKLNGKGSFTQNENGTDCYPPENIA